MYRIGRIAAVWSHWVSLLAHVADAAGAIPCQLPRSPTRIRGSLLSPLVEEAVVRVQSIAAPVVVLAALLVGCGGGSDTTDVDVSLKEFTVTPDPIEVDAGEIQFTADNIGTEVHEMVIVRAKSAGDLPTDAEGAVDEEQIAKDDQVGEVEDVPKGKTKSISFDLKAGDYVIFCNVVDDEADGSTISHFNEGMHESVTVK
jgi:uncharacterized cupredoxin-like copper-binding protein